MPRRALTNPAAIRAILILQLVPLILFPAKSFSGATQEWWLPVLLALMVLAADFALIVRRTNEVGPWYLISFAQGFNIIARLMMLFPHATQTVNGATVPDVPHIVLSFLAIALSAFLLWYTELPEVRMGLARQ
ncbi:MAG: hypothetical protein IT330_04385 [Anaerolineae bacterium]|nr:hypothetical protein [Anaerolineae bacterium]